MTQSLNELINYEAGYRTAPATPGLLIIVIIYFFLHNRQGTSGLPVSALQEGQYGLRRTNTDSGVQIRIQEGQ